MQKEAKTLSQEGTFERASRAVAGGGFRRERRGIQAGASRPRDTQHLGHTHGQAGARTVHQRLQFLRHFPGPDSPSNSQAQQVLGNRRLLCFRRPPPPSDSHRCEALPKVDDRHREGCVVRLVVYAAEARAKPWCLLQRRGGGVICSFARFILRAPENRSTLSQQPPRHPSHLRHTAMMAGVTAFSAPTCVSHGRIAGAGARGARRAGRVAAASRPHPRSAGGPFQCSADVGGDTSSHRAPVPTRRDVLILAGFLAAAPLTTTSPAARADPPPVDTPAARAALRAACEARPV